MPPRIMVPLVGEPLPLDFANTRPRRGAGTAGAVTGSDAFATVDGVTQWLVVESDRLPHVRATESTRLAMIALRQHVGAALDAITRGDRPPPATLDAVNAALRAAPGYAQLGWGASGGFVETVRACDDDARLLAALAEATVEYLTSDLAARTKRCEAPDCELLFAPTNPRRRWCSPSVCGNRTRVARYYDRHKT